MTDTCDTELPTASPIGSTWLANLRTLLLIAYFVNPFFTGILAYHWLPNESYDTRKHELLESHEVGDDYQTGDHPDAWMDKTTGKIYTFQSFAWHRRAESLRMFSVWFGYGLIGCFYFAFWRSKKTPGSFFKALIQASLLNAAIALYTFISIRW